MFSSRQGVHRQPLYPTKQSSLSPSHLRGGKEKPRDSVGDGEDDTHICCNRGFLAKQTTSSSPCPPADRGPILVGPGSVKMASLSRS
jgi:hypothetical protein